MEGNEKINQLTFCPSGGGGVHGVLIAVTTIFFAVPIFFFV
jgi:hypothetical protein